MTNILTEAFSKFVPTKQIIWRPNDQPWCNSYTRLLLRKKNRNYQLFKKINSQYLVLKNSPETSLETVTRLKNKKKKLSKNQGVLQMSLIMQIDVLNLHFIIL